MFSTRKIILTTVSAAALIALAVPLRTAIAAGQSAGSPTPATPAITPDSPQVAAASPQAIRLLQIMDSDKSGKISRAEYMAFMAAEFERLDVNHDGELDLKELEKSDLAVLHHGGTHR